ncbi:recombinase RmuC [Phenylobacterium sp. Root77]|jgi:DNA recombination protein RmuC|uniref:DNA recombination protein RmuC n=1 Tax=unclassified Phenylobacterium TaxID=2640670 RepID=UPI0006F97E73|nr:MULTISPECIES: DNA recombination protein RmuC [unclassified Phenylobacterium]KQW73377.1 recombinase RmuC [Phenylobacterium sp. Root1277]KQW92596.1 recombinase RmuC [Phenylobacterium sp. Root1290]KRC40825.1 recombinase RmuC [Phenylobacterium sp. Root77]
MNLDSILLAVLAALLAAIPALAWALMERGRANRAEARAALLQEAATRLRVMEEQEAKNAGFLQAQAAAAIAEQVMKRADETFHNREQLAQARLEAQLKPVAETLAKFQEQVVAVEKTRAEETGGLKEQINQLMLASSATQAEARKLSAALRRGAGVQGRWGEQTLRNVLEAAGLHNRYDFDEQTSTDTDEGRRRPDVTVRLPGGAVFVIDAKCSLNAFLEAQEATDDASREAAYVRHAQSVRAHMQGLSAKAYWDQFNQGSPDFVAMFIPGDSFLAAALERAPELMSEAMDRRVLVVTPTTLFALCKAVVYGWRVEEQAANAQEISKLGRELYKRISVMGAHAGSVGKALEAAVSRYNQFVGSLETQVLTQARRFEDLKVDHEGKELPELAPVETGIRPLAKLAADPDAPETGRLTALTAKGR